MKVSELEEFLATRAYPTYVAHCRSVGRWCETCPGRVHPAELMVSEILGVGDGIAARDRFCCFSTGLSIALDETSSKVTSIIVSVLNLHQTWTAWDAVCSNCGFHGKVSEDCRRCVSGHMIPIVLFAA